MNALSTMDLEHLLGIMRQMQQHASSANWQELARLDNERRSLLNYDAAARPSFPDSQSALPVQSNSAIEKISANPNLKPQDSHHQLLVKEIRDLDKQIIQEAEAARAKSLARNRGLHAQVKAKNLYAQTHSIT